ncbi:MAG: hypothetical protein ACYSP9_02410 [Planctomycetota bacterium]
MKKRILFAITLLFACSQMVSAGDKDAKSYVNSLGMKFVCDGL